jgi:DNA recombination protein RmuC
MDALSLLLGLGIGAMLGIAIGYLVAKSKKQFAPDLSAQLAAAQATETELRVQLTNLQAQIEQEKLKAQEENKILVQLAPVKQQLEQMQTVVAQLEKERSTQFASISEQLRNAVETDENLRKQTQTLAQALSSNSLRGVWGEAQLRKLVELAGLIKHADFSEQATISTEGGSGRHGYQSSGWQIPGHRFQGAVQLLSGGQCHLRACHRRRTGSQAEALRGARQGDAQAHR